MSISAGEEARINYLYMGVERTNVGEMRGSNFTARVEPTLFEDDESSAQNDIVMTHAPTELRQSSTSTDVRP
jgi:hypothetical protein